MEIKGTIKEISFTETQAKVKLADGMTISSNMPFVMEAVKQFSEGDSIVADVYSNPGKPGTRWAGIIFYNINSIGLDLPVINVRDELKEEIVKTPEPTSQEPEKPVEIKTTTSEPVVQEKPKDEQEDALAYTPESAQMEIGKKFLEIATLMNEFFKVFRK